jgi:hypothetical protein
MRNYLVPIRITRTRRCREGFYLLVNGVRIHFLTRAAAVKAIDGILLLQRIQVVSVREYAAAKKGTKPPLPKK